MSTYWYFQCHSHDPVIRSDMEFTQHTGDDHYEMAIKRANSRPLDPDTMHNMDAAIFRDKAAEYYTRNAVRFLLQHPECELKMADEYGNVKDIPVPPVTVADLFDRLAHLPGNMLVEIRGRQGDAVLVTRKDSDLESDDELFILYNGGNGETIMAKD